MSYVAADLQFVGGLFWDGRATGSRLGSTAAEQAQGPFLADKEQNHANPAAVLAKLRNNRAYISLWQAAYGTPDINISTPTAIQDSYDKLGYAIAEYEASAEVNQFSSKWDAYKAGRITLSAQELEGQRLFLNEGGCRACHNSTGGNKNRPFQAGELFTDFSYHNLGLPVNPDNPGGNAAPDPGLGGFLATAANPQWRTMAAQEMGKFKTPTLRNVGKAQRFMHNGAFRTLEEVVHFYNTRDVFGAGFNGRAWGLPEYFPTMDREHLGGLGDGRHGHPCQRHGGHGAGHAERQCEPVAHAPSRSASYASRSRRSASRREAGASGRPAKSRADWLTSAGVQCR
jgi:cytochrome c peroxidase